MANIYLQGGTTGEVDPPLGYGLLSHNVGITEINMDLVIQAEKNFAYYNKRFLNALNSGVISQAVYNAITENQNEGRQIYELETNISLDKQLLIDLLDGSGIPNVDTGGTAPQILEDILNEGYQVVKKI
jgi:hypothetical protein